MKVVYVLSSTVSLGGASKAFKVMLGGLLSKGVEPIVVLPDKGALWSELCSMGVACIVINYRECLYPRFLTLKDKILFIPRLLARRFLSWRVNRILTQKLRHQNVALVHTNVSVVDVGFRLARNLHVPHIFHIREFPDLMGIHFYPSIRVLERWLNAPNSYSICITYQVQNHFHLSASPRSRVIYDGLCERRNNMPERGNGEYVLFAGRIEPNKGLHILLRAYATVYGQLKSVPPLMVAGEIIEGRYWNEICRFIQEYRLEENITFLGERSDMDSLMQHASVLVVPSESEGFGWCMPEAMLNGCLVIAHDTTGMKEQLDNGIKVSGGEIALRYNGVEQLETLLQEILITGLPEKDAMIRRAFLTVNQLYTSELHINKVYEYYEEIIRKGNNVYKA